MSIIGTIIIGGVAGWAAEKFMKADHGIFTNIFMGIVGGFVGNWVFGLLNVNINGWIGSLITAAVGACLLIWIYRAIRSKQAGQTVEPLMPPENHNDSDNFTR